MAAPTTMPRQELSRPDFPASPAQVWALWEVTSFLLPYSVSAAASLGPHSPKERSLLSLASSCDVWSPPPPSWSSPTQGACPPSGPYEVVITLTSRWVPSGKRPQWAWGLSSHVQEGRGRSQLPLQGCTARKNPGLCSAPPPLPPLQVRGHNPLICTALSFCRGGRWYQSTLCRRRSPKPPLRDGGPHAWARLRGRGQRTDLGLLRLPLPVPRRDDHPLCQGHHGPLQRHPHVHLGGAAPGRLRRGQAGAVGRDRDPGALWKRLPWDTSIPWPPACQRLEAGGNRFGRRGWRRFTLALSTLTRAAGRDAWDAGGSAMASQSGDERTMSQ